MEQDVILTSGGSPFVITLLVAAMSACIILGRMIYRDRIRFLQRELERAQTQVTDLTGLFQSDRYRDAMSDFNGQCIRLKEIVNTGRADREELSDIYSCLKDDLMALNEIDVEAWMVDVLSYKNENKEGG